MRKVFLDEMAWPEAKAALEREAPAFLPVGPIEGHGPHVPMGCDFYIATAVAKLLAERTEGVVLQPLTYNFTGGTRSFRGTVSVPFEVQIEMMKAIIRSLWGQGFRRIFVLSVHGPNVWPIGQTTRTLFEEEHIPVMFLNRWPSVGEMVRERVPNYGPGYWEAMAAYAAARILGKEHAIPDLSALRDEEVTGDKQLPEPVRQALQFGMVGFHYTHEHQHIPPRANINVDLGVEILGRIADGLVPAVDALGQYVKWLEENPRRYIGEERVMD